MSAWYPDFGSWSEFVDFCDSPNDWDYPRRQPSREHRSAFSGTDTFAQAVELGRRGWPEGADRISAITAQIGDSVSPRAYRHEIGYSVAGPGVTDMNRYLQGHPESYMVWRETEDEITSNRGFLTVTVNLCASGAVDSRILFTKGAAACALVDALEREGYRCEVDIYSAIRGNSRTHLIDGRVRVKNSNDPLEPETLAMALANPATFRRLTWALWEKAPDRAIRWDCAIPSGRLPVDTERHQGDIHLSCSIAGQPQWNSTAAAAQWVRDQLRLQGIETEV